ncbi:glycosyl transferase [Fusarium beomiforme]|uniref:Glycosyl transferase n=1 Tax=Fusarium beomiforme TaxID=44412 RepID=A0A9P5AEU3_9HYPO|nr:glycosyl transferase [Fusarium beomiforme]
MLCSSQMHDKHAHLYPAMVTEYEAIFSGIYMRGPLTIEMMHSLLCLCLWPIPQLRLWQDPSWGYIGLVVNAAMQLNCHLPPNPLVHAQLRQNASRRAMPVIDAALDMITDHGLHSSQTQNFINELEMLKGSNQHTWSPEAEINLQGAKLYLYAMTLLLPVPDEPVEALQAISNRDTMLQNGLMSASALISKMLCRSREQIAPSPEIFTCSIAFWPKTQITYLFYASTFIFRVLLSHSNLTRQDRTLAMSRLADAQTVFKMEPPHPDRTRAALLIQRLIEVVHAYTMEDESGSHVEALPPRDLLVTGRLGASVMFDAILRSVHYRRRKAQRRKNCSADEPGTNPASAPASGSEGRVVDQSSSAPIEYWPSLEGSTDVFGPVMDAPDMPGFSDAFNLWGKIKVKALRKHEATLYSATSNNSLVQQLKGRSYKRVPTWRVRTELWNHWLKSKTLHACTACWIDEIILREEPLLKRYWHARDYGSLDEARQALDEKIGQIASAIDMETDVSEVSLLAIKISDLYAMGLGSDANTVTAQPQNCYSNTKDRISVIFNDVGCWPISPGGVDEKIAATDLEVDVVRAFVPLLTDFVKGARTKRYSRADLVKYSNVMLSMAKFYETKDYACTWKSKQVERAWMRAWLIPYDDPNIASVSECFEMERPSMSDFRDALNIYLAYLFIYTVKVPDKCPRVFQSTHHGISSLQGMVLKPQKDVTFGIWDHAIFWRETCLNISPAQCGLPLSVQSMLLAGMSMESRLAYFHADVIMPCASVFNPMWEIEMGTDGGTIGSRNMFERKVDPIVNGISNMDAFKPADKVRTDKPTVIMLSNVQFIKGVKIAIQAADIIINQMGFKDY